MFWAYQSTWKKSIRFCHPGSSSSPYGAWRYICTEAKEEKCHGKYTVLCTTGKFSLWHSSKTMKNSLCVKVLLKEQIVRISSVWFIYNNFTMCLCHGFSMYFGLPEGATLLFRSPKYSNYRCSPPNWGFSY